MLMLTDFFLIFSGNIAACRFTGLYEWYAPSCTDRQTAVDGILSQPAEL